MSDGAVVVAAALVALGLAGGLAVLGFCIDNGLTNIAHSLDKLVAEWKKHR